MTALDTAATCYLTDYRDTDREALEDIGAEAARTALTKAGVSFEDAIQAKALEVEGEDFDPAALQAYNDATEAATAAIRPHTGRAMGWFVTLGER